MFSSLVAIVLALLPVRRWDAYEERYQVTRTSMISAVLTSAAGLALVMASYLGAGGQIFTLIAFYVLASGMMRAASGIAGEPRGDLLLSVIDDAIVSRRVAKREMARASERERREGAHVPDRLVKGAAIGRPDLDVVLIASRVKEDWNAGTCLLGADGVPHRIGEPFDVETPAGLRRAYPLSDLPLLEPMRHVVHYELPDAKLVRLPRNETQG